MNPGAISQMLEPLREPLPVGWWPLAPGWWVVLLLLLALLTALGVWLWRVCRRRAPLREARRRLGELRASQQPPAVIAAALSKLQRQTAIAVAGRRSSAGLTGQDWAAYLNTLGSKNETTIDPELADLAYRREISTDDCERALVATERWLQTLVPPR